MSRELVQGWGRCVTLTDGMTPYDMGRRWEDRELVDVHARGGKKGKLKEGKREKKKYQAGERGGLRSAESTPNRPRNSIDSQSGKWKSSIMHHYTRWEAGGKERLGVDRSGLADRSGRAACYGGDGNRQVSPRLTREAGSFAAAGGPVPADG